jgi:hypothetical protein
MVPFGIMLGGIFAGFSDVLASLSLGANAEVFLRCRVFLRVRVFSRVDGAIAVLALTAPRFRRPFA